MTITAVIVFSGRHELLIRCVSSLLSNLHPRAKVRIILNGEFPATVAWLAGVPAAVSWAQIRRCSRSTARNFALEEATSDLVYFLDDDVLVPDHLMELALKCFDEDPELAILGGPNLTPRDSTFAQKIFGAALTSFFCAPKIRTRYTAGSDRFVRLADQHDLILCNLVVRRKMVWPALRFAPNVTSNEENLFIFEAQKQHLKIGRLGQLYVYHVRRPTLKSFLTQIRSYGFGRGEQMLLQPASNHILFYLSLVVPGAALATFFLAPKVALWGTLGYAAGCVIGALFSPEARALGPHGTLATAALTPLVHFNFIAAIAVALVRHLCSRTQPTMVTARVTP